jgi:hypothetical protein
LRIVTFKKQKTRPLDGEKSKGMLSFKIMGQDPAINFPESYFDIPENTIEVLIKDLKNTKNDEINQIDTKLFKLNNINPNSETALP